jgi:hypothetical protein
VSDNQSTLAPSPNEVNVDVKKGKRQVNISQPCIARDSACLAASELLVAGKSPLFAPSQPDSRTTNVDRYPHSDDGTHKTLKGFLGSCRRLVPALIAGIHAEIIEVVDAPRRPVS